MNNKTIAGCLLVSFLLLFLAEYTGGFADTLYAAGALSSLIFGVLAVRYLNSRNKKSWLPYAYIVVAAIFCAAVLVDKEDLSSLSFVYFVASLLLAVELLRKGKDATQSSGVSSTIKVESSVFPMTSNEIQEKWEKFKWIFWGVVLVPLCTYIFFEDSDYLGLILIISGIVELFTLVRFAFIFSGRQMAQLWTFLGGLLFPLLGYLLVWEYKNEALKKAKEL